MTISKIDPRGYIATKDETTKVSLESISENIKLNRAKILNKIQDETLKKISESTTNSKIDDVIPKLYATDENDPENAEFFKELKRFKKTNPTLYKKIVSMD